VSGVRASRAVQGPSDRWHYGSSQPTTAVYTSYDDDDDDDDTPKRLRHTLETFTANCTTRSDERSKTQCSRTAKVPQ